ncbi:2-desacetyl-2-hydroxyethyl bacteriochlorophyllide A dehydrogenase [Pseudoclavibacter sp. JAI123]|uniref:zinc-dependent alcohol dehydrogenase n=1 Tax=Pseudoclavibacter sp. JAI123 TaxID=2723065 RepID=UPI0015CC2C38|nr:alcohol dehydrogenase catalytic domain-containing protein [Pseudoclavibacter sp. JAI123]NYF12693.1 2-desacetyl-2-hydroxyethyl bacteriochlorophyllide A dehydrogenase [Pseudoclavibacter sp. JAI123]
MRAAQYSGEHRIVVNEVEAPAPASGEVQIRVAYTGICGTDLHVLHGSMDARVDVPQAIGHEMSGTVESVGADVTAFAAGDKVTVMPLDWCGACPACKAGNSHVCQNLNFVGIDSPGSLQELWNVREDLVVPLPASLSLEHAALVEPLAVACHDVSRSRLTEGETAVIIGGGPIGQLIALVAAATGAVVYVIEPNPERRALAQRLGARTIDPTTSDAVAIIEEATGSAGADVVFEVAGVAVTALTAVDYAKVRGRVVLVAIHPNPVPINLHRVFWRELELIGARVYVRADFERAIELLASGAVPADELITSVVGLSETQSAFDQLSGAAAMKILVNVQEG